MPVVAPPGRATALQPVDLQVKQGFHKPVTALKYLKYQSTNNYDYQYKLPMVSTNNIAIFMIYNLWPPAD